MNEREFRRVLNLFPVVRSRDFCADSDSPEESTSKSTEDELNEWENAWAEVDGQDVNIEDPFWQKLKSAAEMKVGPAVAERFCKAFQRVHKELISKEQNLEAIQRFVEGARSSRG